MTVGVRIYNNNGALVIDSENRHTTFFDKKPYQLIDVGMFGEQAWPFGNLKELGAIYNKEPGFLYWVRFPPWQWGIPALDMYKPGQFEIIRTSRRNQLQKGYLNVYDGGGNLVWSDISAYDMPRITHLLQPSTNIDNVVEHIEVGYNPYILVNSLIGDLWDDGYSAFITGMGFRSTGTGLDYKWLRYQTPRGYQWFYGDRPILRIPLAYFNFGR